MPVEDVARTGVMTAGRDQTAGNLATVMREEAVGSVVIADGDRPVGIVTDRDLVVEVLEPRRDSTETTAGDLMTETLVTVETGTGIMEATETMSEHGVRRLPVVDGEGSLAGLVTLDDLTRLFADELTDLAAVIERESPPY